MIHDLDLLATHIGAQVRQQHVEFLGRKLAIVEVMPLRPQPAEVCKLLGDSRHHRAYQ